MGPSGTYRAICEAVTGQLPAGISPQFKRVRSHDQAPGSITVVITEHDPIPVNTDGFIRGFFATVQSFLRG